MVAIRRAWRYQRGNQNPYIEEEQTTQWPKEKVQKDKQRSTKHTYKTKDRVTRTALKTGGELMYPGRVGSVTVIVLPTSAVYSEFEPRSGQTKDYKIVFVAYLLSTQPWGERATTGWLGIRIMCLSRVTCLSADCCFGELALYKNPTKRVGLVQSGPQHHLIENQYLLLLYHNVAFIA
jgi:hypothetical protein